MTEEQEEEIDWESPFDEIRSSEVNDISLKFLTNGGVVERTDEKDQPYRQFRFKCIDLTSKKQPEITYTTSSKRLIEELQTLIPLKGKSIRIVKSGSNFQTKYKATIIK